MDPLSETDVIQTDSPENFVVIFELPIDKEWKSNEIESGRCWASCGFNSRNATHQVDFFPTSTTLEFELRRTLQLRFVSPNKIRIQFLFHSPHSVVDYLKYC